MQKANFNQHMFRVVATFDLPQDTVVVRADFLVAKLSDNAVINTSDGLLIITGSWKPEDYFGKNLLSRIKKFLKQWPTARISIQNY